MTFRKPLSIPTSRRPKRSPGSFGSRDIGGMIVIDFVDMEGEENEAKVLQALEEALKADRTKTNVVGFTGLGLVEMTRKKVRRKLSALLLEECKYCGSTGKVYSPQAMAMRVRREVHRYVLAKDSPRYLVEVSPATAKYIEECNNQNQAILGLYEGKHFYLKGNRRPERGGMQGFGYSG